VVRKECSLGWGPQAVAVGGLPFSLPTSCPWLGALGEEARESQPSVTFLHGQQMGGMVKLWLPCC
jgi:hypothetical protein